MLEVSRAKERVKNGGPGPNYNISIWLENIYHCIRKPIYITLGELTKMRPRNKNFPRVKKIRIRKLKTDNLTFFAVIVIRSCVRGSVNTTTDDRKKRLWRNGVSKKTEKEEGGEKTWKGNKNSLKNNMFWQRSCFGCDLIRCHQCGCCAWMQSVVADGEIVVSLNT